MPAGLLINSDIVKGALIHPTLPMSHIVESITIDKALLDATLGKNTLSIPITPKRMYNNPFFIISASGPAFYSQVIVETNRYVLYAERAYYRMQGYLYWRNPSQPVLTSCTIYVGEMSGG